VITAKVGAIEAEELRLARGPRPAPHLGSVPTCIPTSRRSSSMTPARSFPAG
jgi:hypothetical protein